MDYTKYITTRLDDAKTNLRGFKEVETDQAVLLAKINNIRNVFFEILDYTVNHFPGSDEKILIYIFHY